MSDDISRIDYKDFETGRCFDPEIIHISGIVYAVVYSGPDSHGCVITTRIYTSGLIWPVLDKVEFDPERCSYPDILHVSGEVFAIAYEGPDGHGFIKTITVRGDGQIDELPLDSFEFETDAASNCRFTHVSGEMYAIAFRGPGDCGVIKTITIHDDGQIEHTVIDSLEFDARCFLPDMVHISGEAYALAYQGSGDHGFIKTATVHNDGQIENSAIDSFEFEGEAVADCRLIHISGEVYAVAFRGTNDDGFIKTLTIHDDGQIEHAVIDTLEFDMIRCFSPRMAHIAQRTYALAYRGQDHGLIKTSDARTRVLHT